MHGDSRENVTWRSNRKDSLKVKFGVENGKSDLLAVDDFADIHGGLSVLPQVPLLLEYEALTTFSTQL